ncbi:DUF3105 domain-containing protein [Nocardioides zeae]|uniref:DUF3105 domain-containing protein n=1 Tax=Nocardioides imazamoxiresistens TaxID=3231893 RepID=A0ABU3PTZ1_9ACTN|nr:DUF3105 domain-containing protein [Nocardioides zeae]MDT9592688.1 DUF3105 domain-containing protein [Nocardioides zeae]
MAKTPSNDRAAKAKKQLKAHQRAERRGSYMIVGVCAAVAILIVGAAAYRPVMNWWDLRKFNDIELASIGSSADVCGPEIVMPASGEQDHRDSGPIDYTTSPPIFGPHRSVPATMDRKFYTPQDRPEVEQLVHNVEHGYTFLWYDQTVAEDDELMDEIEGIATKLRGTDNFRLKFKAVPWNGADENQDGASWATDFDAGMQQALEMAGFPDAEVALEGGAHIAITHWAATNEVDDGGEASEYATTDENVDPETGQPGSFGVVQYCSAPSGEALEDFMLRWPYYNSTEPNGM